MSKPEVTRRDENGDRTTVIHAYAPGDGFLSFVAKDPHTHRAVSPGPTREECEAVMPKGWELFAEGSDWRARKIEATRHFAAWLAPVAPEGWNEDHIAKVAAHYDGQPEDEAADKQ